MSRATARHSGDWAGLIARSAHEQAEAIAARVVSQSGTTTGWEERLDDIVTSRYAGYPIMLGLLALVLWLTIAGANYPSELLSRFLLGIESWLAGSLQRVGAPAWLLGLWVHGMYRGLAWVVGVMLPPMAIFFPLFSLLEDFGYLPRVAFNLDPLFKRAGAHGKQALTMCMGFGCNAAGVMSCRIIDSPRERLIAILTNVFVPCNGRFPLLFALSAIFLGTGWLGSAAVGAAVLLGVTATLLVSRVLSLTLLRGMPSGFVLELPRYRPPQLGKVLVRSLADRTLFVLSRAVLVAAPAGAITWLLANTSLGGTNLITHLGSALEPLGRALGMDGLILTAFILGLPANEIVLPVLIMSYIGAGTMVELDGLHSLAALLVARGWTWRTAVAVMLFSLLHFPCGTTILTVARETGSRRWAALAAIIPTAVAVTVCLLLNVFLGVFTR